MSSVTTIAEKSMAKGDTASRKASFLSTALSVPCRVNGSSTCPCRRQLDAARPPPCVLRRRPRGHTAAVRMLTEEQLSAFRARKRPRSVYLEVQEIISLINDGFVKSAWAAYMRLRVAKRKTITRPQLIHLMQLFGREYGLASARVVFDDMLRRHKASTYAYNVLMRLYARDRAPNRTRALFEEMQERFVLHDAHSYAMLIDAHGRAGDRSSVIDLRDELLSPASAIAPNEVVFDAIMRAFTLQEDYSAVVDTERRRHAANVPRTSQSYSYLINALHHLQRRDTAEKVYSRMKRELAASWNEYEARRVKLSEEAEAERGQQLQALFSDAEAQAQEAQALREAGREPPRTSLWRRVPSRALNFGSEHASGLEKFDDQDSEYENEDAEPSEANLDAEAQAVEDEEQGEEEAGDGESYADEDYSATEELNAAELRGEDNVDSDGLVGAEPPPTPTKERTATEQLKRHKPSMKFIIEGFVAMMRVRAGDAPAVVAVLDDVRAQPGFKVGASLLVRCLEVLLVDCDPIKVDDVLWQLDSLRRSLGGPEKLPYSAAELNIRLRLATSLRREGEVSLIHTLLKRRGTPHDNCTFNLLLEAYIRLDKLDTAVEAFEELRARRLMANLGTYNILLAAFAQRADTARSEELLRNMVKRKLPPNARSLRLLLDAYVRARSLEGVLSIGERMRATYSPRTPGEARLFLNAALQLSDEYAVGVWVEEARELGIALGEATVTQLVEHYVQFGQGDALAKLLGRLALPFVHDGSALNEDEVEPLRELPESDERRDVQDMVAREEVTPASERSFKEAAAALRELAGEATVMDVLHDAVVAHRGGHSGDLRSARMRLEHMAGVAVSAQQPAE